MEQARERERERERERARKGGGGDTRYYCFFVLTSWCVSDFIIFFQCKLLVSDVCNHNNTMLYYI